MKTHNTGLGDEIDNQKLLDNLDIDKLIENRYYCSEHKRLYENCECNKLVKLEVILFNKIKDNVTLYKDILSHIPRSNEAVAAKAELISYLAKSIADSREALDSKKFI